MSELNSPRSLHIAMPKDINPEKFKGIINRYFQERFRIEVSINLMDRDYTDSDVFMYEITIKRKSHVFWYELGIQIQKIATNYKIGTL